MPKVWVSDETWINMEHAEGVDAVRLMVDDREISALGGQTIKEAVARIPGVAHIPALCHHPAVKPYGACRLCTVEVSEDGGEKFKLVTACLYPIKEGMQVKTNSERVRRLRKGILELLLARAPGVSRIQELAAEYGVEQPRFTLGDQECILCGLCVRACQEITGKSAISLANRGIFREVSAPFSAFGANEDCIGCGDCMYVCPTGAIKMGPDGKPVFPRVRIPAAELEVLRDREGNP